MSTGLVEDLEKKGGYNPEHYAVLDAVEDRHFWFRARRSILGALAAELTRDEHAGYHVLDAGCGNGSMLPTLQQSCPAGHVFGMDLCFEGLPRARRRTSCPLVQGSINDSPFRVGFALIGMFDVLEHIPDDIAALRAVHDLLDAGGAFLIAVPAHMSLWSYFDVAADHCRRYSTADLRNKLSLAGFHVEYLTQFMSVLYPIMWFSRRLRGLRQRFSKELDQTPTATASRELQVAPWINALLTWLLKGESLILRRRWVLPIGTSLLAIARKRST